MYSVSCFYQFGWQIFTSYFVGRAVDGHDKWHISSLWSCLEKVCDASTYCQLDASSEIMMCVWRCVFTCKGWMFFVKCWEITNVITHWRRSLFSETPSLRKLCGDLTLLPNPGIMVKGNHPKIAWHFFQLMIICPEYGLYMFVPHMCVLNRLARLFLDGSVYVVQKRDFQCENFASNCHHRRLDNPRAHWSFR